MYMLVLLKRRQPSREPKLARNGLCYMVDVRRLIAGVERRPATRSAGGTNPCRGGPLSPSSGGLLGPNSRNQPANFALSLVQPKQGRTQAGCHPSYHQVDTTDGRRRQCWTEMHLNKMQAKQGASSVSPCIAKGVDASGRASERNCVIIGGRHDCHRAQ